MGMALKQICSLSWNSVHWHTPPVKHHSMHSCPIGNIIYKHCQYQKLAVETSLRFERELPCKRPVARRSQKSSSSKSDFLVSAKTKNSKIERKTTGYSTEFAAHDAGLRKHLHQRCSHPQLTPAVRANIFVRPTSATGSKVVRLGWAATCCSHSSLPRTPRGALTRTATMVVVGEESQKRTFPEGVQSH